MYFDKVRSLLRIECANVTIIGLDFDKREKTWTPICIIFKTRGELEALGVKILHNKKDTLSISFRINAKDIISGDMDI